MEAMAGEVLFLDTNVLLIATDALRPYHKETQRLFAEAGSHGFHLAVSGQVLREYLAVATRPADSNGLGLEAADAVANVERFMEFTNLFEETATVALRLRELVGAHCIRGKGVHDANIVATMVVHRILCLITENGKDFARFEGIRTLSIDEIVPPSNS